MTAQIDNTDRVFIFVLLSVLIALLFCSTGCVINKKEIVQLPGSPALIVEGRGRLRVFAYSKERKTLVEIGWTDASDWEGWTLTKYDWEARIAKDKDDE